MEAQHPLNGKNLRSLSESLSWFDPQTSLTPLDPSLTRKKIAVLGGGQLGWMLAAAGRELNTDSLLITQDTKSSLFSSSSSQWTCLPFQESQPEKLGEALLAEGIDTLVLESEFYSEKLLAPLSQKVRVIPSLHALKVCRNKWEQKQLFLRLGLASAAAEIVPEKNPFLDSTQKRWVYKWSEGGYDGKGVYLAPKSPDPSAAASLQSFLHEGHKKGIVYREEAVSFQCELALVSTRSQSQHVFFPLVLSEQKDGICYQVLSPATAFGIDPLIEKEAQEMALTLGQHLDIEGTFALEFFLDEKGKLLINEMAPRVHNSGHLTLFYPQASQFHLHMQVARGDGRNITIPDLGKTYLGMINILGPKLPCKTLPKKELIYKAAPNSQVYWYGKDNMTHLRKLGHVSVRHTEQETFLEHMKALRQVLEEWQNEGAHSFI